MSTDEDAIRVEAVTAALAGPRTVWVLTYAYLDRRSGLVISPAVFNTRELALTSFELSMRDSLEDVADSEEELKEDIAKAREHLSALTSYEDGDTTWSLDEAELRAL